MNHCLLVVGYDLGAEKPYWILRNQWGEGWGDGGMFYLEIGGNDCGIANDVGLALV